MFGDMAQQFDLCRRCGVPLPVRCTMTLAELCEWWLKEKCPAASKEKERSRLRKHIMAQLIGKLIVGNVTTAALERRFGGMATGGASNASINSLRAKLRTIYNRARKAAVYTGTNAAADTEHRRATKSRFPTLRAEHADPLLQAVPDQWRALFATALLLGLRKGELFGMRVCDVDLITNS